MSSRKKSRAWRSRPRHSSALGRGHPGSFSASPRRARLICIASQFLGAEARCSDSWRRRGDLDLVSADGRRDIPSNSGSAEDATESRSGSRVCLWTAVRHRGGDLARRMAFVLRTWPAQEPAEMKVQSGVRLSAGHEVATRVRCSILYPRTVWGEID